MNEIVEHVRVHVGTVRPHDRLALGIDADGREQAAVIGEWLEYRSAKIWLEVNVA
jgi:hypothetical protein